MYFPYSAMAALCPDNSQVCTTSSPTGQTYLEEDGGRGCASAGSIVSVLLRSFHLASHRGAGRSCGTRVELCGNDPHGSQSLQRTARICSRALGLRARALQKLPGAGGLVATGSRSYRGSQVGFRGSRALIPKPRRCHRPQLCGNVHHQMALKFFSACQPKLQPLGGDLKATGSTVGSGPILMLFPAAGLKIVDPLVAPVRAGTDVSRKRVDLAIWSPGTAGFNTQVIRWALPWTVPAALQRQFPWFLPAPNGLGTMAYTSSNVVQAMTAAFRLSSTEEGTSKRWPIEDLYDRDWTLGDVEYPDPQGHVLTGNVSRSMVDHPADPVQLTSYDNDWLVEHLTPRLRDFIISRFQPDLITEPKFVASIGKYVGAKYLQTSGSFISDAKKVISGLVKLHSEFIYKQVLAYPWMVQRLLQAAVILLQGHQLLNLKRFGSQSWLKKATLSIIAGPMAESTILDSRDVCNSSDEKGDRFLPEDLVDADTAGLGSVRELPAAMEHVQWTKAARRRRRSSMHLWRRRTQAAEFIQAMYRQRVQQRRDEGPTEFLSLLRCFGSVCDMPSLGFILDDGGRIAEVTCAGVVRAGGGPTSFSARGSLPTTKPAQKTAVPVSSSRRSSALGHPALLPQKGDAVRLVPGVHEEDQISTCLKVAAEACRRTWQRRCRVAKQEADNSEGALQKELLEEDRAKIVEEDNWRLLEMSRRKQSLRGQCQLLKACCFRLWWCLGTELPGLDVVAPAEQDDTQAVDPCPLSGCRFPKTGGMLRFQAQLFHGFAEALSRRVESKGSAHFHVSQGAP
ncbi:unnamed protein product [Symbiodinium natans]|uniref:Uncharacterized protein n=1 Tax=Symbiodinium natans TaxID=878477 RepID=A0A812SNU2_9DINO|nr:unnamed protein product [Symbiodinium natans]